MRYTEARLTEVAHLLLEGIGENAIDFKLTYDGSEKEPVVLPGAFPNLLANGAQGIAVGMATSIPPHNAAELCDACLHLISAPNARSRTLLKYVHGPDFPTGGVIVDPAETIAEAYSTGRGSFRVRARWEKEDTGRGTYVIVISEIPWLVQKGRLVERIAELINDRKLPLVADARDESAEDIRLSTVALDNAPATETAPPGPQPGALNIIYRYGPGSLEERKVALTGNIEIDEVSVRFEPSRERLLNGHPDRFDERNAEHQYAP